jgi:hypothetical protein
MVAEGNTTSCITNSRMVAYAFSKIAHFKQICSTETIGSALALLRFIHAKTVAEGYSTEIIVNTIINTVAQKLLDQP